MFVMCSIKLLTYLLTCLLIHTSWQSNRYIRAAVLPKYIASVAIYILWYYVVGEG